MIPIFTWIIEAKLRHRCSKDCHNGLKPLVNHCVLNKTVKRLGKMKLFKQFVNKKKLNGGYGVPITQLLRNNRKKDVIIKGLKITAKFL